MRPTTYKWLTNLLVLCLGLNACAVICGLFTAAPEWRLFYVGLCGLSMGCAVSLVLYPPKVIGLAARQDHLEAQVATLIGAVARAQADLDAIKSSNP
jgi:hypothetical protein